MSSPPPCDSSLFFRRKQKILSNVGYARFATLTPRPNSWHDRGMKVGFISIFRRFHPGVDAQPAGVPKETSAKVSFPSGKPEACDNRSRWTSPLLPTAGEGDTTGIDRHKKNPGRDSTSVRPPAGPAGTWDPALNPITVSHSADSPDSHIFFFETPLRRTPVHNKFGGEPQIWLYLAPSK